MLGLVIDGLLCVSGGVCLHGLGWHEELPSCLAWTIDGLLARLGVA
jgi:hypothetical protein